MRWVAVHAQFCSVATPDHLKAFRKEQFYLLNEEGEANLAFFFFFS